MSAPYFFHAISAGCPIQAALRLEWDMALDLPLPNRHCRKQDEALVRSGSGSRTTGGNHFSWAGVTNGKWHIESRYPTQAKGRLEWGTQHLLLVWESLTRSIRRVLVLYQGTTFSRVVQHKA